MGFCAPTARPRAFPMDRCVSARACAHMWPVHVCGTLHWPRGSTNISRLPLRETFRTPANLPTPRPVPFRIPPLHGPQPSRSWLSGRGLRAEEGMHACTHTHTHLRVSSLAGRCAHTISFSFYRCVQTVTPSAGPWHGERSLHTCEIAGMAETCAWVRGASRGALVPPTNHP